MGKGQHPNSKKALELGRFKPGHTPPPTAGRPAGALSLKERMQKYLDLDIKVKMPDGSICDKTILDQIILSLLGQAAKGNIKAIEQVLDRNFGKEAQPVELTGRDGQPLAIEHSTRLSEVYERAANAFSERPGVLGAGLVAVGPVLPDDDRSKS